MALIVFGTRVETCISCGCGVLSLEFIGGLLDNGIDCEDMISGVVLLANTYMFCGLDVPPQIHARATNEGVYHRLGEGVFNHDVPYNFLDLN